MLIVNVEIGDIYESFTISMILSLKMSFISLTHAVCQYEACIQYELKHEFAFAQRADTSRRKPARTMERSALLDGLS